MNEQLLPIIRSFLNTHHKAVLSTVSPQNAAEAAMMLYVVDDDFIFYWGTKKSFRKYTNLQSGHPVAITVMEGTADPLKTLQVEGCAEFIVPDDEEYVYTLFDHKNPSKFFVRGQADFVLFKVVPTWMRWLDGSSGELKIIEFKPPFT